jgi:hypothetical protein
MASPFCPDCGIASGATLGRCVAFHDCASAFPDQEADSNEWEGDGVDEPHEWRRDEEGNILREASEGLSPPRDRPGAGPCEHRQPNEREGDNEHESNKRRCDCECDIPCGGMCSPAACDALNRWTKVSDHHICDYGVHGILHLKICSAHLSLRNDRARNACRNGTSLTFNALCAEMGLSWSCLEVAAAPVKYVFHVHAGSQERIFPFVFRQI